MAVGTEAARALTVSPPLKEFSGNPGETLSGMIRIYNETDADVNVTPSLSAFGAKEGESGEPKVVDLGAEDQARSLASWITLAPGPYTVKSLDWQNILFEIRIPQDAEPGGHYAVVFFSPQASDASQSVTVDSKTGSLVLLTVSGDIQSSVKIESFDSKGSQRFFAATPVPFELRLRNEGNVHFRPGGAVQITSMFGSKKAEIPLLKENTGGNVLPQSIRRFDVTWGEATEQSGSFWASVRNEWRDFHFGRYTAQAVVALPDSKTETRQASVWIIPWHLLLVIFILLVALFYLFRTYNRWIIRQARKNA